jgi:methionyl-tRNA formyltransferase
MDGRQPVSDNIRCRVAFLGSKSLGLTVLKELHSLIPDQLMIAILADDRKDARSNIDEHIEWCCSKNLPYIIAKQTNLKAIIEEYRIDSVIVAGWYHIIPNDLIQSVNGGFFGLHASHLPHLRGNAPLVWAILSGLNSTAVTLFKFDEGIDTGPILGIESIPIQPDDTIKELLEKSTTACQKLIQTYAIQIASQDFHLIPQNDENATYAASRTPDDGRIIWQNDAVEICRLIRAIAPPYPAAFSILPDGSRIRILKASIFRYKYLGSPGQATHSEHGKRVLCCGNESAIILEEIEMNGLVFCETAKCIKYGWKLQ